ncbi:MAG: hypothetical protein KAU31_03500, partial [Spirochaetaceae bacterium]|nr:hypothetical protein [Spirochaetaceae bacterium]
MKINELVAEPTSDTAATIARVPVSEPPFINRIISVWYRHVRVYSRHLISNALPPFLEPLI